MKKSDKTIELNMMNFIILCDEMHLIGKLAKQGKYFLKRHALKRLKERGFERKDVEFALTNGLAIVDSDDETKYRVICKINGKCITLIVLIGEVLVIKTVWESKKWEKECLE